MYSHITLGTNDFEKAIAFYDPIMELLGHPVMFKTEAIVAFGTRAWQRLAHELPRLAQNFEA